jgi:hypothetical protein
MKTGTAVVLEESTSIFSHETGAKALLAQPEHCIGVAEGISRLLAPSQQGYPLIAPVARQRQWTSPVAQLRLITQLNMITCAAGAGARGRLGRPGGGLRRGRALPARRAPGAQRLGGARRGGRGGLGLWCVRPLPCSPPACRAAPPHPVLPLAARAGGLQHHSAAITASSDSTDLVQ